MFEPPAGLLLAKGPAAGATVWVQDTSPPNAAGVRNDRVSLVRVVLTHSEKQTSVDEAELGKLAVEMPKAFDECPWTHRRHESRARPDGARVGLIEGDCDRSIDLGALGLPAQKVRTRKLQLVFPDDTGTSIVTASYPTDEAPRWEPAIESAIDRSTGVAVRAPAVPSWTYAAWAVAGLILGWFATAIGLGREASRPLPSARGAREARSEGSDG